MRLPRSARSAVQSTRDDTPARNSVLARVNTPARAWITFVMSAVVLPLPVVAGPGAGACNRTRKCMLHYLPIGANTEARRTLTDTDSLFAAGKAEH